MILSFEDGWRAQTGILGRRSSWEGELSVSTEQHDPTACRIERAHWRSFFESYSRPLLLCKAYKRLRRADRDNGYRRGLPNRVLAQSRLSFPCRHNRPDGSHPDFASSEAAASTESCRAAAAPHKEERQA